MNRDEIAAAFREADGRLEAIRERAAANERTALLTGDWRVRDALSHVAARANSVPIAERWLQRVDAAPAQAASVPDIHDVNAGQVAERSGRTVSELIDEAIAGHAAAVARMYQFDDNLLGRPISIPARNIETTFGAFLVQAGPGHERNHLSDIEAVLEGAS